jgi:hypothetical protein
MDMSRGRTTVVIDRVVLRGVDPRHAQALTSSLKAELSRVLSEPQAHAALTGGRRAEMLRLGKLPLAPGAAGARRFGANVARSLGKGMRT